MWDAPEDGMAVDCRVLEADAGSSVRRDDDLEL